MGKLSFFTNLNLAAIKGDDFPESNSHDSRLREIPGFGRDQIYPDLCGRSGERSGEMTTPYLVADHLAVHSWLAVFHT